MKQADVVLVCPPVSPLKFPSFGLSLLKTALTKENITCYIDYAHIYYLNAIGEDYYKIDWMNMDSFFVEYVFALAADIKVPYSFEEAFQLHIDNMNPDWLKNKGYKRVPEQIMDKFREAALRCIAAAKEQTERTVERVLAMEPKIVGCCATAFQLNASLAILKRIKELRPDLVTIIGGYHCFGESGVAIVKEFPYLDYVFSGESDDLIAPFCASILKGEQPKLEYGILKQGGPYPSIAPHRVLKDMNLAQIPDYSDYLELLASPEGQRYAASLQKDPEVEEEFFFLFESSRGCWWGAKSSCTFCGLNGVLKHHRCKDAEVFLKQLEEFVNIYNIPKIVLADTLIPVDYMEKVVPRLAEKPLANFISEIKAIMSEKDIALLSKAGYKELTIGIESLSDHILQLMHKGTLAINNLATLKYCMKHHINTGWNLLTDFPGETAEDYREQLALLPLIEHLKKPGFVGPICYVRNNEYVNNPEKYGIKIKIHKGMYCISPDNEEYVKAVATVFEPAEPLVESLELKEARELFKQKVCDWIRNKPKYGTPHLDMRKHKGCLKILDTRACRTSFMHKLYGVEQVLYNFCEQPRVEQLIFKAPELACYTEQEIKAALTSLMENKLLVKIKNSYLALAVEIDSGDFILRYVMQVD